MTGGGAYYQEDICFVVARVHVDGLCTEIGRSVLRHEPLLAKGSPQASRA